MPRSMSDKMKKTVFLDLGLADYRSVWQKQEELMDGIKARKSKGETTSNYLLFVEHPHVYTLGKSGDAANMLINSIQLQAKQAEFVKVDRGGILPTTVRDSWWYTRSWIWIISDWV